MPTPFVFSAPRDAKSPVTERLEWLTDIQTSHNGTEAVRYALRAFPRYVYDFTIHVATDASFACLQALREKTSFLVPLWPHAFQTPATAPDAGIAATAPLVLQLDHKGSYGLGSAPVSISSPYDLAAPVAPAIYAANSRSFSPLSHNLSTGSVSFRLSPFNEAVAAYSGPMSASFPTLPLLDGWTGTADGLGEQIADVSNSFENNNLDLYESNYLTRTYTVNITLTTRAAVLDFRRLLFKLRGRYGSLRWTSPSDGVERTWRLAADTVDIVYLRPGYATCTLSLFQLSGY